MDGLPAGSQLLVGVKEMCGQMTMEYIGFEKTGQRMTVD